MVRKIFVIFSILAFFILILTTNFSIAGGGGGCGDDTGCNNLMIGIGVGGIVLLGIAFIYYYYSGPKAKDQSFINDSSLPILNFVIGRENLEKDRQGIVSADYSEQRVMEGGKFVLFRW